MVCDALSSYTMEYHTCDLYFRRIIHTGLKACVLSCANLKNIKRKLRNFGMNPLTLHGTDNIAICIDKTILTMLKSFYSGLSLL